jgi:hypothetical protein
MSACLSPRLCFGFPAGDIIGIARKACFTVEPRWSGAFLFGVFVSMKKILSPLMAAALVAGLSMGTTARAEGGAAPAEAPAAEAAAKPNKKAKAKAKGKHHAKKAKKDMGCGKDGNGCHTEEHGHDHGAAPADAKKE